MKTSIIFFRDVVGLNIPHIMVRILYTLYEIIKFLLYIGFNYDGSQVPAEWFGWLHHKTDYKPFEDPSRPNHKWMLEHTENLTGTPQQYMPYSTTKQKIIPWKPPMKKC